MPTAAALASVAAAIDLASAVTDTPMSVISALVLPLEELYCASHPMWRESG
jgi:hypothetical protein